MTTSKRSTLRQAFIFAAALIVGGLSLSAQEFGADLTTQVTIQKLNAANPTLAFTQKISPWVKLPIDANGSVFQINGHFGATISEDYTNPLVSKLIGDVDLFRLAFVFPAAASDGGDFKLELGRLQMEDTTRLILVHPADGLLLGIEFPGLKIEVQGGLTSFILHNSSSIIASQLDERLAADKTQTFGTSRLLAQAQFELPNLFLKQNLSLSFLGQQDLNTASNFVTEDSVYNPSDLRRGASTTAYGTLKLSGPLADTLYYDTWFSYGLGKSLSLIEDTAVPGVQKWQYKPISSFLTGISFDLFTPKFLSGAFNLKFMAASGDGDVSGPTEGNTDGEATQFIPLTTPSIGLVFSPKLTNLMVAQIGGTIKPFEGVRFQTGLKYLAFFRPTTGATFSDTASTSTSPWLGQEINLTTAYRLSSDVGLSLNGGLFIPGIDPGAFQATVKPVQYSIQFALTLGI